MNILVLSDLHIDHGDKFGIFKWDTPLLIEYIKNIINKFNIQQVILNGDIFELYKYKYEDIAKHNNNLVSFLSQPMFIHIKGNHDITSKIARDSYVIKNKNGQTIYFEHGHKADFLNGTPIGRVISKVGLKTLKWFMKNKKIRKAYFRYIEIDDQITRMPKKYNSYKYLQHALKLLKQYDVVFLGHTHKIEAHHTYYLNRKKRYINCGSCSMGRFQAVIFNTESLRYEIIKTDKDNLHLQHIGKEISIYAS